VTNTVTQRKSVENVMNVIGMKNMREETRTEETNQEEAKVHLTVSIGLKDRSRQGIEVQDLLVTGEKRRGPHTEGLSHHETDEEVTHVSTKEEVLQEITKGGTENAIPGAEVTVEAATVTGNQDVMIANTSQREAKELKKSTPISKRKRLKVTLIKTCSGMVSSGCKKQRSSTKPSKTIFCCKTFKTPVSYHNQINFLILYSKIMESKMRKPLSAKKSPKQS
jgi:hypothetical protein